MSTYYYFVCDATKTKSCVAFTRQAWGWGAARPTKAFKFLMKYVDKGYQDNIRIVDEHNDILDKYTRDEVDSKIYQPRGYLEYNHATEEEVLNMLEYVRNREKKI